MFECVGEVCFVWTTTVSIRICWFGTKLLCACVYVCLRAQNVGTIHFWGLLLLYAYIYWLFCCFWWWLWFELLLLLWLCLSFMSIRSISNQNGIFYLDNMCVQIQNGIEFHSYSITNVSIHHEKKKKKQKTHKSKNKNNISVCCAYVPFDFYLSHKI